MRSVVFGALSGFGLSAVVLAAASLATSSTLKTVDVTAVAPDAGVGVVPETAESAAVDDAPEDVSDSVADTVTPEGSVSEDAPSAPVVAEDNTTELPAPEGEDAPAFVPTPEETQPASTGGDSELAAPAPDAVPSVDAETPEVVAESVTVPTETAPVVETEIAAPGVSVAPDGAADFVVPTDQVAPEGAAQVAVPAELSAPEGETVIAAPAAPTAPVVETPQPASEIASPNTDTAPVPPQDVARAESAAPENTTALATPAPDVEPSVETETANLSEAAEPETNTAPLVTDTKIGGLAAPVQSSDVTPPTGTAAPVVAGAAPAALPSGQVDAGPRVPEAGPDIAAVADELGNQQVGHTAPNARLPAGHPAPNPGDQLALATPNANGGVLPIQPPRPPRPVTRSIDADLAQNNTDEIARSSALPGPGSQRPFLASILAPPPIAGVADTPPVVDWTSPPAPGIAAAPAVLTDNDATLPPETARAGSIGGAFISPPSRDNESGVTTAALTRPVVRELPGNSSAGFNREVANVRVNRLPTIGNAAPEAELPGSGTTASLPSVDSEEAGEEGPIRALDRFAAPFEVDAQTPVVGVVLLDSPQGGLPVERLAGLPFPVSVAIDPAEPGVAERAAALRQAGVEVFILATLQEVYRPSDIEVALETYRTALPEAAALIEAPSGGMPTERQAERQLVSVLMDTGQALVTFPRGLNTIQRLAQRDGVPARMIDGDFAGQSQLTANRVLDRAAFRAGRDGGAIVVGTSDEATVSILLSWMERRRDAGFAVGPGSAVLKRF